MIYFTSDQHFCHANIIKYCNRPFKDVNEMNEELISRHNSVVGKSDVTIHVGDFSLGTKEQTKNIISKLNGSHIFLLGDHDRWTNRNQLRQIYFYKKQGLNITVCHYCMRVWSKSHHNSWHLYGHSHGRLNSVGKSLDIGVDTNHYYPYSMEYIKEIMETKPDNFNLIRRK